MRHRLRWLARRLRGLALHPRGITCLECGFLALGQSEVSTAERVMLGDPSIAVQPRWENVNCQRSLWVDYELTYVEPCYEGVRDEISRSRRECDGFYAYRPGWSPAGHRELLLKFQERRSNILFLLLGSALTLLGTWLAKHLGLQ